MHNQNNSNNFLKKKLSQIYACFCKGDIKTLLSKRK